MRLADGYYWLPTLPRDVADAIAALPEGIRADRAKWPTELRDEYQRLRADFTSSKAEFLSWLRKDRDSRMIPTAKEITRFMVESLNFDTGRCDPSHHLIADELNISIRTVERLVPRIAESGWVAITRRGKTTTNFYRFRVTSSKVNALIDLSETLRQQRKDEREERRRQFLRQRSDPTQMSDHSAGDPTQMADHEPTSMTGHEPTPMTGKPLKRTFEGEHLNKKGRLEEEEPIKVSSTPSDLLPACSTTEQADRLIASLVGDVPIPSPVQTFFRQELIAGRLRQSTIADWLKVAA